MISSASAQTAIRPDTKRYDGQADAPSQKTGPATILRLASIGVYRNLKPLLGFHCDRLRRDTEMFVQIGEVA